MDDTLFNIITGSVILVKNTCFFIKMYYSIIIVLFIILFIKIGEMGEAYGKAREKKHCLKKSNQARF